METELSFAWPWMAALLGLPLLVRRLLPPVRRRDEGALRVPFFAVMGEVQARAQAARPVRLRVVLAAIGWLALVLAAMRPQWVGPPAGFSEKGRDLLLVVDVSGSMDNPDMEIRGRKVDRLTAVKDVAAQFIARRKGDRVGIVLFGDRAHVLAPPTHDLKVVADLLSISEIALAGGRTNLTDGIAVAAKALYDRPADSKVMVLLTDGRATPTPMNPLMAAALAATQQIRIHTIGFGSENAPTPSQGIDEPTLREISRKTGGRYFRASDSGELERIYGLIDEIEPVNTNSRVVRPIIDAFIHPLAIAILCAFLLGLAPFAGRIRGWLRERRTLKEA